MRRRFVGLKVLKMRADIEIRPYGGKCNFCTSVRLPASAGQARGGQNALCDLFSDADKRGVCDKP